MVALVQTKGGTWADPSSATFDSPVTEGNLILAVISERSGGDATTHAPSGAGWTPRVQETISQADSTHRRSYSVHDKVAGASESATITADDGSANNKRISIYEFALETGEDQWTFLEPAINDNGATGNADSISTGNTSALDTSIKFLFALAVLKNNFVNGVGVAAWSNGFSEVDSFGWQTSEMVHSTSFVGSDSSAGSKETTFNYNIGAMENAGLGASLLAYQVSSGPARVVADVDGDNDIYAGQTFTINATGLDSDSDVRSVSLGTESLTVESWSEVSPGAFEISVTLPLYTSLEQGVTHTLTVTDDTGALVFGTPVMVSLNPGWESVALSAVPAAETRSFFHEIESLLGFTPELGDILFLVSHANQTISGDWSPTIEPPVDVSGVARVWDASAGAFTAPIAYAWSDGGSYDDTTDPVITLQGDNPLTWAHGQAFVDPGYTATDDRDGDITANVNVTGVLNINAVGSYVLSYDVTDAAGNASATVQRTVNVTDQAAPVITLLGDAVVNRTIGQAYTDAGATAIDAVDGDLTNFISVGGDIVNTNVAGTYTITYDVTDGAGNVAAQVTRSVVVSADTTLPVILLTGSPSIIHPQGTPYTDAGATASDDTDGDVTGNIVTTGASFDVNTTGVYTVRYNVTDAAGNDAVEVTRTVTVQDQEAPEIDLTNGNLTLNQGEAFSEPGYTATDNNDGIITDDVVVGGDVVDSNVPGVYVITYDVTDSAGNAAVQVTRAVTVSSIVTQDYVRAREVLKVTKSNELIYLHNGEDIPLTKPKHPGSRIWKELEVLGLVEGETITSMSWQINGQDVEIGQTVDGLTLEDSQTDGVSRAKALLSGGTPGVEYMLTLRFSTQYVPLDFRGQEFLVKVI